MLNRFVGPRLLILTAVVAAASLFQATVAMAITGVAPDLGVAGSFAVLAGSTVTNTGSSTVSGNLGVSPGTAVTGFPPGTVTNGSIHAADAMAAQAQSDATTAYNYTAGQKPCTDETGKVLGQDIGTVGSPMLPGVYCFSSSAQLTGALHLSGAGVYIFQVGTTLTTAPGSSVVLDGTASACQVFWQVGSSATIDTTTAFEGTLMALASITVNNAAVIHGRVLARNGQVSLINDTITVPPCGGTATTTVVSSSSNPAKAGQPVTFTATVTGATSGTVTFYDGTTKLGTATVDTNGKAQLTVSTLTPGAHPITAVFSGTPTTLPSASTPFSQTTTAVESPSPSPSPALPSAGVPGRTLGPPWSLAPLVLFGMMLVGAGLLSRERLR